MAKSQIGKYRNKTGAGGYYDRTVDKAARDVLDGGLVSKKRKGSKPRKPKGIC